MPRPKKIESEIEAMTEMPRRPRVTVTKRRDIIERRIANPHAYGADTAPPVAAAQAPLQLYIADLQYQPLSYWRHLGWEPATREQFADNPEEFGWELREGRLVRGPRGSEVLLQMPKSDYDAVMRAKAEANRRQALGAKETKSAIVERASSELGDEPAEFLHRSIDRVQITDTMERVSADEP